MTWPTGPIPVAPVINLSGPATIWGTSISSEAVAAASAHALRHHWDMAALGRWANETIARWSGAEAGTLTACSAAGITLTVAACMTGGDPGRISQLPDASGMKRDIVIQKGHTVHYGAPIEQMIRLAGARVREVGSVNRAVESDLTHALGAGLFIAKRPDGSRILKIVDFGIAKTRAEGSSDLFQTVASIGSPLYMSPEQLTAAGTLLTASTLLLFIGCTGKSAQIPLYVWLPTPWQARRRFRRSSMPRRWSRPASTSWCGSTSSSS